MKISDLITKLSEVKQTNGDLDISIDQGMVGEVNLWLSTNGAMDNGIPNEVTIEFVPVF